MRICGIELKSNQAIICVIENNSLNYINTKIKKITLEDDEKQKSIREFCNNFLIFLKEENIEKIFIKKRSKKGNFAGGAVTFKMESLIQLNPHCSVELISSQSINSYQKKNNIDLPKELNKYQENAYLSAIASI